jgi:hypothetical protein
MNSFASPSWRVELMLALWLSGCVGPTIVVADYRRFTAPDHWEQRYHELEACAGQSGPKYWSLRFFTADVIHTDGMSGEWESYGEIWIRPADVIMRPQHAGDGGPYGHAMMHAILRTTNHVDKFAKCGVP